jgi:oxygen-independent coproporphyrinogen-3 oxidase
MQQTVKFEVELLRRYDVTGPRYTSYPTAAQFRPDFGVPEYRLAALRSNRQARPLSLYLHIPFCTSPCFYCGCTRIITRDPTRSRQYLDRLFREIELQAEMFAGRTVDQLHFGGGTPTFLDHHDMSRLMDCLTRHFMLSGEVAREVSIEIDPRTVTGERMAQLAALGFNRISFGVQDFDPRVQEAVNRIQSVEHTFAVMDAARGAGIRSINLDLIYGLPFQTVDGFTRTLETVIESRPERLAVYSYAHLPRMFKAQRRIRDETLPDAETKLALLGVAIETLTQAGYVYIGMDHFALPEDELVTAQQRGDLQRNFQGYSTRADCDMIGLGMSAIGKIADTYSQNTKDIGGYYAALDDGRLPIARGLTLTADDRLRRGIIQRIMCRHEVRFSDFQFDDRASFLRYFSNAAPILELLEGDGLVQIKEHRLAVTATGRLLLRVVAMAFDARLPQSSGIDVLYSRVV